MATPSEGLASEVQAVAGSETTRVRLVSTTVDSEARADALAHALVSRRLAACAQVEPIRSTYWWEGRLERSAEWRVVCKTTARAVDALVEAVLAEHPYALAEVLVIEPLACSRAYEDWVNQEVSAN